MRVKALTLIFGVVSISHSLTAFSQELSPKDWDSDFVSMALASSKFWEVHETFEMEAMGPHVLYSVVLKIGSKSQNQSFIFSEAREAGSTIHSLCRGVLTMSGSANKPPRFEFSFFPIRDEEVTKSKIRISTLVKSIEDLKIPGKPKLALDGFEVELRGRIDGIEVHKSGWYPSFDESCGLYWELYTLFESVSAKSLISR